MRIRNSDQHRLLTATVLVFVSISPLSQAQTWDGGAGNGNWNEPNNWDPNGLPMDAYSTALVFTGNVQPMTVQNIIEPFRLNSILFKDNTQFSIKEKKLRFGKTVGGVGPKIVQQNTNAHAVEVGVELEDDLALDGVGIYSFDGPVFLRGVIEGTSAINVLGGSFYLGGVNTYSGGTRLVGGGLLVDTNSKIEDGNIVSGPIGTGTLTIEGGEMGVFFINSITTLDNPIELDGDVTFRKWFLLNPPPNLILKGSVNLGGGTRTVTCKQSMKTSFRGVISANNNGFGLTKNGPGELALGGANTYGGVTTVTEGRLLVEADNALGAVNMGTVVQAGGILAFNKGVNYMSAEPVTLSGGTIQGFGDNDIVQSVSTFHGNITLAEDSVAGAVGNNKFVLQGEIEKNGKNLHKRPEVNSWVRMAGKVKGVGDVFVDGEGLVTLEGDNTYTGPTFVQSGTLEVANSVGSATSTGQVTVDDGATLTGSGSIAGSVAMADGARLIPGGDPDGTMEVGDLSLSSQTQLQFRLGSPGNPANSKMIVAGDLTLNGSLTISPQPGLAEGVFYTLFEYGGTLSGPGIPSSPNLLISTFPPGQVRVMVLSLDGIPTLSTWSLLVMVVLFGVGGSIVMKRRHRTAPRTQP